MLYFFISFCFSILLNTLIAVPSKDLSKQLIDFLFKLENSSFNLKHRTFSMIKSTKNVLKNFIKCFFKLFIFQDLFFNKHLLFLPNNQVVSIMKRLMLLFFINLYKHTSKVYLQQYGLVLAS